MRHAARRQARHGRAPPARRGDGTGRGRPVQRQPLVRVGPVPLRARVGHGARGLQRQRRRVELVPARPRPVALVPVERGRDGGALRHPARAVPRVVAVERRRPDPQGADVRPDRSRGQPRRGREGVLVVSWTDCPATRGCGGATTTRRRRSRTSSSSTRTPAAARRSASTSCSTPACSTTTGSGRWRSPTPRSRRPRCSRSITVENRGPDEATIDVLPTLWFRNTVEVVRRPARAGPRAGRRRGRGRGAPARRVPARGRTGTRRRAAARGVLRQRDEHRSPVRRPAAHGVPEGRHQRPRRLGGGHGQPGAAAAPRRPGGTT